MNIPVLIVACICLLALFAHILGGTKETASLSPHVRGEGENEKLTRSWEQAMCAFQMLSVDLLLVTGALFTILLTDIVTFEYELTLFLSLVFLLWGVAWLIQMFWLKSKAKAYFILPQWLLWFVCSGLLYWGA